MIPGRQKVTQQAPTLQISSHNMTISQATLRQQNRFIGKGEKPRVQDDILVTPNITLSAPTTQNEDAY